jgi:PhzF family phenazine biosynthesis protein
MKLKIYQVDAFTNQLFAGNPAAVCPLEKWIDDLTMQQIAAENNLAKQHSLSKISFLKFVTTPTFRSIYADMPRLRAPYNF